MDDNAISQWWERVKFNGFSVPYSWPALPKSTSYNLYDNSCSTIVYKAMLIGGADTITDTPSFATITPIDIYMWAMQLKTAEVAGQVLDSVKKSLYNAR